MCVNVLNAGTILFTLDNLMDFITINDVWSFRDILNKLTELLDTEPTFIPSIDGEVRVVVPNPNNDGYTALAEILIYERYAQIKFRNPSKLVEHQLELLPWMMGLNYYIWDDNEYDLDNADSVISTTMVYEQHIKFSDTEEQYFQHMTQHDNSFFTMEELRDAKLLMKRMYEYFNITPVPKEK